VSEWDTAEEAVQAQRPVGWPAWPLHRGTDRHRVQVWVG